MHLGSILPLADMVFYTGADATEGKENQRDSQIPVCIGRACSQKTSHLFTRKLSKLAALRGNKYGLPCCCFPNHLSNWDSSPGNYPWPSPVREQLAQD